MATKVQVDGYDDLLILIQNYLKIPLKELIIKKYGYDSRIDWDTHMVLAQQGDGIYPVGFINRRIHKPWKHKK